MTRFLALSPRACRSVLGPGFSAGGGGATTEVTVAGLSTDPGQVLGTGLDGGVLLLGTDIISSLDGTLGSIAWRQAQVEPVLSFDTATRALSIEGGVGTTLPLATQAEAGLLGPVDKTRIDAALQPGDGADALAPDPVSSLPGDLTLLPGDARRFIKMTGGAGQTVTVDAGSLGAGEYVTLVKTGTGTIDIVPGTGSPVLVNATSGTLTGIPQGAAVSIKATDTPGEYILIGRGG